MSGAKAQSLAEDTIVVSVSRVTAITLDDIDDAELGLELEEVMVPALADGSDVHDLDDLGKCKSIRHDAIDRLLVTYLLDLDRKR